MAIFRRKHIDLILEGRKTATRRTHVHGWKIGKQYGLRTSQFKRARTEKIIITRKFRQLLGDISLEDVRKEGYETLDQFKQVWIEINGDWKPDKIVTVYEFKLLSETRTGKPLSAGETP